MQAKEAVLRQGFTSKQAEVILETGYKFQRALVDARDYYKAILKTLPNQKVSKEKSE